MSGYLVGFVSVGAAGGVPVARGCVVGRVMDERPGCDWVYKVCSKQEWERAVERGTLEPSSDDRRDGFMHLSTREQLEPTLQKHFPQREGLVILALRTADLAPSALRWEVSRGGQLFPHWYGPLPASAVRQCFDVCGSADALPLPG